ncbi:MAG: transglycosylase domain-containing protein, partial [Eubacterium sp.]
MRKVQEIMRARYVEEKYSKDTIVECYLNTIHLGNGVDGVEVAATYYFDKHASDLTLNEMACLAALTKSPSGYDPYKHAEENKTRRNWVLDEMLGNGYITQAEHDKAVTAELKLRKKPATILSSAPTIKEKYNSYFVDTVIEDVIAGLMDSKKYSYEYAEKMLYQGGYKIYTTVDMDIQKHLEEVYNDDDNFTKITGSKNKDQKPN